METLVAPGISPEELKAYQARRESIIAAQSVPMPGPLLEAIEPTPVKVCGYDLKPIMLSTIGFLQRIDSPLMRIGEIAATVPDGKSLEGYLQDALTKPREGETEAEAKARVWDGMIESFYVIVHTPKTVRELLVKGIPNFKKVVAEEMGDTLGPAAYAQIATALAKHFASAFSTVVGHEPDVESNGSFQSPQVLKATG